MEILLEGMYLAAHTNPINNLNNCNRDKLHNASTNPLDAVHKNAKKNFFVVPTNQVFFFRMKLANLFEIQNLYSLLKFNVI